jgi:chromosome segregation ATPase
MGIFSAIWRFITLQNLRQGHKLQQAGDKVFTKDAAGRAAAFDLENDRLVKDYKEFLAALSQAEVAVEQKEGRLKKLQEKLAAKRKALNGAINLFNKAQEANDAAEMENAKAAGKEYSAEVKGLEEQESALKGEIEGQRKNFKRLNSELAKMKERIANLPAEKAESIANFVSNKAFIEAQQRLDGILMRSEASPLEAVHAADEELAATAKVVADQAGYDRTEQHEKYMNAATEEAAEDDFMSMAAAKKAEKADSTGVAAPVTDERTKF